MKTTPAAAQNKPSIWLQLYFVLASLIGLIMVATGFTTTISTVLKGTLLSDTKSMYSMPPQPYMAPTITKETTTEQKESLAQWEQDYQRWQEQEKGRDYEAEQRKRDLANAIAWIITGIPIFALHAPKVFRQFNAKLA